MAPSPRDRDPAPSRALAFSRALAVLVGFVAPAGEIARRWPTLAATYPPHYLDDVALGAFLLVGAWSTRRASAKRETVGVRTLGAAWGFTLAIALGSFSHKVETWGAPDPGGWAPPTLVAGVIGLGAALAAGALLATILAPTSSREQ